MIFIHKLFDSQWNFHLGTECRHQMEFSTKGLGTSGLKGEASQEHTALCERPATNEARGTALGQRGQSRCPELQAANSWLIGRVGLGKEPACFAGIVYFLSIFLNSALKSRRQNSVPLSGAPWRLLVISQGHTAGMWQGSDSSQAVSAYGCSGLGHFTISRDFVQPLGRVAPAVFSGLLAARLQWGSFWHEERQPPAFSLDLTPLLLMRV